MLLSRQNELINVNLEMKISSGTNHYINACYLNQFGRKSAISELGINYRCACVCVMIIYVCMYIYTIYISICIEYLLCARQHIFKFEVSKYHSAVSSYRARIILGWDAAVVFASQAPPQVVLISSMDWYVDMLDEVVQHGSRGLGL